MRRPISFPLGGPYIGIMSPKPIEVPASPNSARPKDACVFWPLSLIARHSTECRSRPSKERDYGKR